MSVKNVRLIQSKERMLSLSHSRDRRTRPATVVLFMQQNNCGQNGESMFRSKKRKKRKVSFGSKKRRKYVLEVKRRKSMLKEEEEEEEEESLFWKWR